MHIIIAIARKEYISILRDKLFWMLAAIIWGLLLVAAITGWQKQQG